MILIDVSGANVIVRKQDTLTSGMVGAAVVFRFDEDWNSLAKTAVFRAGKVIKDAIIVDSVAEIPHEVLATYGYALEIGVYGTADDGAVVIPTVWAKTDPIKPGTDPSGDKSLDPSLPVWAQMQEQLDSMYRSAMEIMAAKAEVMQTAEDAKEDLYAIVGGGGLNPERIAALDGMFKIAAYTADATSAYSVFRKAFGLMGVEATGITLSVSTLRFTETGSKRITATVKPSNTTDTVEWKSSDTSVATVVDGLVTPVADGSCSITATAGSVSASCAITVAFAVEVVYLSVGNNLTNCASNNSMASIVEGGSYTATLTAANGYTLEGASVSVVVNGVDVTDTAYTNGVITIQSVTGNVVITATAVEEKVDSGEVVMLSNISFDGTSYLDTEVIPESVNYRYVIGIQTPSKEIVTNKHIGGISMRDTTSLADSAYWDLYWYCTVAANNYNADVPSFRFSENCMGLISENITTGNDKGDGASSQPYDHPMYFNLDNGSQSVWINEECTEAPVAGHFPAITKTIDFTGQSHYTDDEHPIDSIWLGKVHVTGIMGSLATEANTYAGVKFYCFKVYDTDENPIADMHPAKQGKTIGMWDSVRNKFYPVTGTANYEEVSA